MSPTRMPGQTPSARRLARKAFEEGDHRGMAPIAIARQAHHLPGLAVDRQRLGAGQAAARVKADRARLRLGGRHRASEDFLGGQFRIGGIGDRRQGRGIERALVLRERARVGAEGRSGEPRQSEKDPSHRSPPRFSIARSAEPRPRQIGHQACRPGAKERQSPSSASARREATMKRRGNGSSTPPPARGG